MASSAADGDRVIGASRRPDGTLRKERRVRAGYTPQDEVQVYVSRGSQARRNAPKCPGFEEEPNAAPTPKAKAAAKNAKRKEKRHEEAAPAAGAGVQAAAAAVQALSLGGKGAAPASGTAAAAAEPAAAPGEPPSLEKQIRALRKKVRQCDGLAEKRAAGHALTEEEAAKLAKVPGWQREIEELERRL